MKQPLKIIIFDGSFKTRPFINRLAKELAVKHEVYILGFNEKLIEKIKNVRYVALGSNQSNLKFASTAMQWLFRAGKIQLIIPTFKKLVQGDRHYIQKQHLKLALSAISADVIHLQWPSVITWFEDALLQQKTPIILSQRGFHSNVRPFVDEENFQYLKTWYPKMAGFHSVSKAISENGDKVWNTSKKIDSVVYTGLDLYQVQFHKNYKRSSPLQLLSVGRPHWIKGYDYALQACKLLKERDIVFKYTIVGAEGNEELQFLIHDLGLQEYVVLENRLSQKQVYKKMQESSLLLMTSIEEGIPNVAVEAMAIGLPVISTNCGGMQELIVEAAQGWLVPINDPHAMANKIEAFKNFTLQEINAVLEAARKKVELQHNKDKMITEMEQLYYKVMKGVS